MEISAMISELKNESIAISRALQEKETEANHLRNRLHVLESEIQPLADRYDAIKMAIDSLELVSPSASKQELVPAVQSQASVKLPEPVVPGKPVGKQVHSRKGKKIGKYDARGKKIGEYRSINQAATSMGWTNVSVKKYIEGNSKEKQIRLRGYYLEYIAS